MGKFSISRMIIVIKTDRLVGYEGLSADTLGFRAITELMSGIGFPAACARHFTSSFTSLGGGGLVRSGGGALALAEGLGARGLLGLVESSTTVARWCG